MLESVTSRGSCEVEVTFDSSQPMGPDPLGWFSKPFESMEDFQSIKYRSPPGIAGQTYSAMGVPAVAMPGGDIVPAAQRGTKYCPSRAGSKRRNQCEYAGSSSFCCTALNRNISSGRAIGSGNLHLATGVSNA